MYIQLKDFNYVSAENKDWLYIFVQSFICVKKLQKKNGATFTRLCSCMDPQLPAVLSPCVHVIRRMIKPPDTYVYSLVVKYVVNKTSKKKKKETFLAISVVR